MEAIGLVLGLIWRFVAIWPVRKLFFWIVDVIPSRGENEDEAREIVQYGRMAWLLKKFNTSINEWTDKDTDDFVSALNWRARWFFHARERTERRVSIFQEHYEETGEQPGELRRDEIERLVAHLDYKWFETAVMHGKFFRAIIGFLVITIVLIYLNWGA
jgi:hypothetical protein